jgi:1-acyl-sn-glycerol-3-phosphate acyltransferase
MEILMNGGTVIFYPEGKTVKESNKLAEPRRGIGALGIWSGSKILPVAIKRAHGSQKTNEVIFGKSFLVKDIIPRSKLQHTDENYMFAAKAIMARIKKIYFN